MTKQYTLILPIKVTGRNRNDLQRFIEIQLRSLNKFLDASSVYEFLIICKENEIEIIQQGLLKDASLLPIRLVSEHSLIKKKVIDSTSGWYLQQLIKLGVSSIVKTPLYLILDSDCFLTKYFSYENLFYQGKILIDRENWIVHPEWWLASTQIINEIPLTELANQPVIAVTPQILVTDIVCELLDYLSHKEKWSRWDEYLSSKLFTEFTLYWLFLLKTNRIDMYQLSGAGPLLLGNALWGSDWKNENWLTLTWFVKNLLSSKHRKKNKLKTQILAQQVKTSFESNDNFYFSLIQSNIKSISLKSIIEETDRYLSN